LGARLIERDVLKPAALCNGRPLFPAGPEAVAEAKALINAALVEFYRYGRGRNFAPPVSFIPRKTAGPLAIAKIF
jgi:hypothetical protein